MALAYVPLPVLLELPRRDAEGAQERDIERAHVAPALEEDREAALPARLEQIPHRACRQEVRAAGLLAPCRPPQRQRVQCRRPPERHQDAQAPSLARVEPTGRPLGIALVEPARDA